MTTASPKSTLPITAGNAAGPALWRRLSVEEATRNGWWDSVLRLDASRRDPATANKAMRDWVVAQRLVRHLALHLDWPERYFRGFACLDGVVLPNGASPTHGPRGGGKRAAVGDAAIAHLVKILLECRPVPSGRVLASIAKDAMLFPGPVASALAHALQRHRRHLEAARVFDAIVGQWLQPLPELTEMSDRQITIVENYRRYEIVYYAGHFHAFHIDAPVRTRHCSVYSGARFLDVIALI